MAQAPLGRYFDLTNTTSIDEIHALYVGLFPWQAIELGAERLATRGLALDPWPKEQDFNHWFSTLVLTLFPALVFLSIVRITTWSLHHNRRVQDKCARTCYIVSGVVQMIMAMTALIITLTCEVMDRDDNLLGIKYIHIAEHVAKYGTPAIVATINWCLIIFSLGWIETFNYIGFSVGRSEYNTFIRKASLVVLGLFIWIQAEGHASTMAVLQVVAGLLYAVAPHVTRYIKLLVDRINGLRCKPRSYGNGDPKSSETSSELPKRLVENIVVGIASLFMIIITPNVRMNYKYLVMNVENDPFYVPVVLGTIWTVCTGVLLVVFSLLDCICSRFRYTPLNFDQYDTATDLESSFVAVGEDDIKNLENHNGIPLGKTSPPVIDEPDSSDDGGDGDGDARTASAMEQERGSNENRDSNSVDEETTDVDEGEESGEEKGERGQENQKQDISDGKKQAKNTRTAIDQDYDSDVEKDLDREDETEGDEPEESGDDDGGDDDKQERRIDDAKANGESKRHTSLAHGVQVAINMDTPVSNLSSSKKTRNMTNTKTQRAGMKISKKKTKGAIKARRSKGGIGRKKPNRSVSIDPKTVANAQDNGVSAKNNTRDIGHLQEPKVDELASDTKMHSDAPSPGPGPVRLPPPPPHSDVGQGTTVAPITVADQSLQTVLRDAFPTSMPPRQTINVAPEQTLEFFSSTSSIPSTSSTFIPSRTSLELDQSSPMQGASPVPTTLDHVAIAIEQVGQLASETVSASASTFAFTRPLFLDASNPQSLASRDMGGTSANTNANTNALGTGSSETIQPNV